MLGVTKVFSSFHATYEKYVQCLYFEYSMVKDCIVRQAFQLRFKHSHIVTCQVECLLLAMHWMLVTWSRGTVNLRKNCGQVQCCLFVVIGIYVHREICPTRQILLDKSIQTDRNICSTLGKCVFTTTSLVLLSDRLAIHVSCTRLVPMLAIPSYMLLKLLLSFDESWFRPFRRNSYLRL